MKRLNLLTGCVFLAMAALPLALWPRTLLAGELCWQNLANYVRGAQVDVHCPESEHQCGREHCIERCPVEECVKGEKKVWKPSIRHEYVAIPEVRYKWQMKWITKEIPCDGCKPVSKIDEVNHCYESERWDKCSNGCCELHCKTCEAKNEKLECKHCECEPGKTTVKVHYWSYVKVPYTVYRQVEREVCVKQPRCEKVEVPITRYVPPHCCGLGCGHCERRHCEHCNGKGCTFCNGQGYVDVPAEEGNSAPDAASNATPAIIPLPPVEGTAAPLPEPER
jgi:hypothetical protein